MADKTEDKKKRNKRFPSIKEFPNKVAYYDHMIEFFKKKKEDYEKFGDGEDRKKVAKARKFVDSVDGLLKDPKYADVVMELRKKLAPGKPDDGGKKK